MKIQTILLILRWFICLVFLIPMLVQAETRYVADKFEITLRTGPSGSHTIQRMLKTGTMLEVLAHDPDNDYAKVRTTKGTEGWVLNRYLMDEPAARTQLENLSVQLTNTSTKDSKISAQVEAIKHKLDNATKLVATLEYEKEQLENELTEVKQIAGNPLAIDNQNKELRQRLINTESQRNKLLQENHELISRKEKDWFFAGAIVLFAGIIVGFIITRIRWRKRSPFDSF